MSVLLDQYTNVYVDLWSLFRPEVLPDPLPDPAPIEEPWGLGGPTEVAAGLWSKGIGDHGELGPRGRETLARVREWLRGAEQSALDDYRQVEAFLQHCAQQPELRRWEELSSSEEDLVHEALLRVISAFSGTLHRERLRGPDAPEFRIDWPEDGAGPEFRIDWQDDGDGLGSWESDPPTRRFSLTDAARDLAGLHGRFSPADGAVVARQLVRDLREGGLVLPLLARSGKSTPQTTWLRPLAPGNEADRGLLLPERRPAVEDEIVLRQRAPRVARVFEEALIVAAKENMDSPVRDWEQVEAPVAAADAQEVEHVPELCHELQKVTALASAKVHGFLAAAVNVIRQRSSNGALQRRACSYLGALQRCTR